MEYDVGADESVSMAVIRGVSAIDGQDPRTLPPLRNVLDTEALDALFASRSDGTARAGGQVSFVYGGCRVTVDDGERLTLSPLDSDGREQSPRHTDD